MYETSTAPGRTDMDDADLDDLLRQSAPTPKTTRWTF